MGRGRVLQGVRLIQNRHVVVGQDADPLSPQGEVAEEERVVDDEEVGSENALPGSKVEALGVVLALSTQTIVTVAGDQVPDRSTWLGLQIASASVLRLPGPPADGNQFLHGFL